MFRCLQGFWRRICCCCYNDPLKEIDEETRLLPADRPQDVYEKNEIIFYGMVPEKYVAEPLDIGKLAVFTKYTVKKIVFGMNHCLIQFANSKNELGVMGSNDHGQLGLDYNLAKVIDETSSADLNYYTELKVKQYEIESTTDYEILDISTCDKNSLVLIKFFDNKKFGNYNYVYTFEVDQEEYLMRKEEEIKLKAIKREDVKYEKIALIRQIYAMNERKIILTEDSSILLKGVNFNLEIFNSYKNIVQKFLKRINYLCVGNSHLLIFTEDKNLYGMGINEYGEIGIPGSKILNSPEIITFFEDNKIVIKKVFAGSRHSMVLAHNGKLYAFGDNSEGQCSGKATSREQPKEVKFMGTVNIIDIFVGSNHNAALSDKGDVYTWGDTTSGKLGYTTGGSKQIYPKSIPFIKCKNFSLISAGPMQTALVTSNFDQSLLHTYNTINIK